MREQLVRKWHTSKTRGIFQKSAADEKGSAVLEVVIVIAVVLAVALIFNSELRAFANSLFTSVFDDSSVLEVIG